MQAERAEKTKEFLNTREAQTKATNKEYVCVDYGAIRENTKFSVSQCTHVVGYKAAQHIERHSYFRKHENLKSILEHKILMRQLKTTRHNFLYVECEVSDTHSTAAKTLSPICVMV